MTTKNARLLPKRTAVSGRIPTGTTGDESNFIKQGELAVNTADKKLYSFDGSNVFEFGSNSYLGLTGGTVNGNFIVTGTSSFQTLSAATFISGSTNLLDIFVTSISNQKNWMSGSSGISSIKAINSTGLDAVGNYSLVHGYATIASGESSHAEGAETTSIGNDSHSEGYLTTAFSDDSHAEGKSNISSGYASHSEGRETTTLGDYSHTEGYLTLSIGANSHAEGSTSESWGLNSHAEGGANTSIGTDSHAEGNSNIAIGNSSHVEGSGNISSGQASHAEGSLTTTIGDNSHAEGNNTIAFGVNSHAEGNNTIAIGEYSHAEGYYSTATGMNSFVSGGYNKSIGSNSYILGGLYNIASASSSVIIAGSGITATSQYTVYVNNFNANREAYINIFSADTIISGQTNLYDIFQTIGSDLNKTYIQNGLNTYTGGTVDLPTVSISAATLNNLSVTGSSILQSITSNSIIYKNEELDDRFINVTGDTILGNLTVNGDFFVIGTAHTANVEAFNVSANTITINNGEVGSGITAGYAGIIVDRGTYPNYEFIFEESSQTFRVGEAGATQPVATRQDSPVNGGISYWNPIDYKFDTNANLTFNGSLLLINGGVSATSYVQNSVSMTALTNGSNADLLHVHNSYLSTAAYTSNVSGTTNYVPVFNSVSSVTNSIIYQSGTSIGINTLTPSATLDIYGNGLTTGVTFQTANSSGTPTVTILDNGNTTFIGNVTVNSGITLSGNVQYYPTTTIYPTSDNISAFKFTKLDASTIIMNVDTTNSRIGINTATPQASLDVSGTTNITGNISAVTLSAASERIITTSGTSLLQNYLTTSESFITTASTITAITNSNNWNLGSYTGSTTGMIDGQEYVGTDYRYLYQSGNLTRYNKSRNGLSTYTTATTLDVKDELVFVNSTGATTITLVSPSALTDYYGTKIIIKNIGAGIVTLTAGTATIDGVSSQTLNQWDTVYLVSNLSNYFII